METQNDEPRIVTDGENEFIFKNYIKFSEFCLFINDRILINPVNFKILKGEKIGLVGKMEQGSLHY